MGKIKVAAETDSDMEDSADIELKEVLPTNYERGVDVRKRLWDCNLQEVPELIPKGREMLNRVYHRAAYIAAEENIMEPLGDENLLKQRRAQLWEQGYDLDSYERKVFDEILQEEA